MKTKILFIIGTFVVFTFFVACNKYFTSAMSDIKKNKITTTTVNNFETSKSKGSKKVESYYQLARIYHYNQEFQNLDKAKEYYEFLINSYSDAKLKSQYEKLNKKQLINVSTFESSLKNVNDLIDTRTFNSYVKINTLAAYSEFVSKYPNSNHITDAKNKAFEKASSLNTFEDYKKYLNLFKNYREKEAKDKAFVKATQLNTIAEYRNFSNLFSLYRIDEIYLLGLKIAMEGNTIALLNEYIDAFPYSTKVNEAINQRDYLVFSEYIGKNEHQTRDLKGKIIDIDAFMQQNPNNVRKMDVSNYLIALLPTFTTIEKFLDINNLLKSLILNSDFVSRVLQNYIDENVIASVSLGNLPNNFINYDEVGNCNACMGAGKVACTRCSNGKVTCSGCGGSGKISRSSGWGTETSDCSSCSGSGSVYCSTCSGTKKIVCKKCSGSGKPEKLTEDPNFTLASVIQPLQKRITLCSYILKNFPNVSEGITAVVSERKYRDELFILYYPIKSFYDNMSKQPYNEKLYKQKLQDIVNLKSNSSYSKLGNYGSVFSLFSQAEREIKNRIDSETRLKQIAANSIVSKWKLGSEICKDIPNGILYCKIDQFNEDKSSVKIKIIAGPSGDYEGEPIKQGNLIWVSPKDGWHLCLPDEKTYSLANNESNRKEEPTIIYQEPTYSGPTICSACAGRGTQVCYGCNGTGVDTGWFHDDRTCSSCKGSGQYRCTKCGGSGTR